ncbi:MAG: NAD-dependent protein deacylase [Chlamydiae bacterium]|nr:NAD-dependent protein deacylase [Chlamydiota bacterium]
MRSKNITVLTGAGVSAESGIPTFRAADGLWEKYRLEDVATPEAFERNPDLVHEFYNIRRRKLLSDVTPNPAHIALAKLEKKYDAEVCIITQNIDDLHERAGSKNVIHMHGELLKARCHHCGHLEPDETDLSTEMVCPRCSKKGGMRPHVVWFGEIPFAMDIIEWKLMHTGLFLSIGTSGVVYPAAGFVSMAKAYGAETVEINIEKTEISALFDRSIIGKASEQVPTFVEELLKKNLQ